MFFSKYSTGSSTGDSLEVMWDFNGSSSPREYVVEQITTQPAELGWIEFESSNPETLAYMDRAAKKIAICIATSAANRRTAVFLRDNTALYLNDRGWQLFDCLVSLLVPRIRVTISPTRPTVLRSAGSFILNLENPGIGCNWQLHTSDFDWIIPTTSSGRLDAGAAVPVKLAIDWMQFAEGETKVKNNLSLVFDNPDFGNEADRTTLRLTATNDDQPGQEHCCPGYK